LRKGTPPELREKSKPRETETLGGRCRWGVRKVASTMRSEVFNLGGGGGEGATCGSWGVWFWQGKGNERVGA